MLKYNKYYYLKNMEKEILDLLNQLKLEIVKYNPYYDQDLLQKAFLFAYSAHKGFYRLSKEPYITHSIHTAIKLTKLEADEVSIVCALLHDVLDNPDYSIDNIKYNFWEEVAKIVLWVYKLWEIYYTSDMTKTEVDMLKNKLVMAWDDIRIFLIKIADRYHNLETLEFHNKEKRYRIAKETQEVYIPIVNFLSIWEFLTDMYDLCFKYTNEKEYNKLYKLFWKKYSYYEWKIMQAHNLVQEEFEKYWLEFLKIEWRVKTLNSIYKKMQNKKLEINQIYDVLALRVVLKNVSDCYIALWIIHKIFKIKNDRFKDYISYPKNNWYQSIHTTVYDLSWDFLEFQIQTESMYKLNKTWLAAHFIYKWFWVDFNTLPNWMHDILNVQKKTLDSKKFLEKLKQEVIISEIKCYDKNWTRYLLPKESVLIDFAFAYAEEYWKYFSGAFINWVFVQDPFYKLDNWNLIKLQKSKEVFTDYKVENFFQIKTPKAREAMRNIFSKYSKVKLNELWKYLLNNSLEIYWLRHFHYLPTQIKARIYKDYWVVSEDQLYLFLAIESLDYNLVASNILSLSSKLDFKKELSLKVYTKSYDYTILKNITDILFNLNIDLQKINYNKSKNYVFINIKLSDIEIFDNLVSEIKRAPNVLDVVRVFPFRLKLYYLLFSIFLTILMSVAFYLNMFYISIESNKIIVDITLFFQLVIFLSLIFYLRFLVRKMLPDILKYKRFYLSLSILNTFMLVIIIYNWLKIWFDIFMIWYIIINFLVYFRLLYNYKKLKKSQNF